MVKTGKFLFSQLKGGKRSRDFVDLIYWMFDTGEWFLVVSKMTHIPNI